MRSTIIVSALAAVASAFTFPAENQGDGHYAVEIDADGNEVHHFLGPLDTTAPITPLAEVLARSHLEARQIPGGELYCGCGLTMNHADCDAATNGLRAQAPVDYKTIYENYYTIAGTVVAFDCLVTGVGGIDGDWLAAAWGEVDDACGYYVPGTYAERNIENGQTSLIGYMNYGAGDNFCASSISSTAQKC